jgi:protein-tyrosine phosphatase
MVDIHSHVLHGPDDGAKTREQSVEMLGIAERSGTTDIVATPHANGKYAFRPEVIAERIAELSALTSVRIHPGCDFHLQFDTMSRPSRIPESSRSTTTAICSSSSRT